MLKVFGGLFLISRLLSAGGVHDPSVLQDRDGSFYLVSTNNLCLLQRSEDLMTWSSVGQVFKKVPDWVTQRLGPDIDNLWAPHLSRHDGRYWLYYCGSNFGKKTSVIGVASNTTLTSGAWTDLGLVVESKADSDFNAIDPELFLDDDGKAWLLFGSFWSGIQMVAIDRKTGLRFPGDTVQHQLGGRRDGVVEGPSMLKHAGYYFLFSSWDRCCAGVESTYRTMVARSKRITGPYVDRQGRRFTDGYAEQVLESKPPVIGPGGGSVFTKDGKPCFVNHYYDANAGGHSALQAWRITWDKSGWPVLKPLAVGQPRQAD